MRNECNVELKSATVDTLKYWDNRYDILMDSKYVKTLLLDVFGEDCLAKSSAGGNWARNVAIKHDPLDAIKLGFVRGNFETHYYHILLFQ